MSPQILNCIEGITIQREISEGAYGLQFPLNCMMCIVELFHFVFLFYLTYAIYNEQILQESIAVRKLANQSLELVEYMVDGKYKSQQIILCNKNISPVS